MKTRKTLGLSRKGAAIRIEAPGCIVVVRADLRDAEGRPVTRVDVSADGDRYAGQPEQWAAVDGSETGASVRVIEGAPRPGCPVAVVDEEATGGPRVVSRFRTIAEAESWIAHHAMAEPAKVARGGFGIDAPEEMVNPPPGAADDARALAEAERHGAKIARQSDGLFAVLDMDRDSSPLWEAAFRTEAGAARAFLAWVLR